jgi:hypothetical protein
MGRKCRQPARRGQRGPVDVVDVPTGPADKAAHVPVIPERGGDICDDYAEERPEDNDEEADKAGCCDKIHEKADGEADIGVGGPGELLHKMIKYRSFPETDQSARDARVVIRSGTENKTQAEA